MTTLRTYDIIKLQKDSRSPKNGERVDTMTNRKPTKRDNFNALLAIPAVAENADLVAFIEHEIELLDKDFLTVQEVSECIHCDAQLIRDEASKSPKYLGFPITKVGHSFKIPKEGFLRWYRGEIPVLQVVSSNQLFRDVEKCGL